MLGQQETQDYLLWNTELKSHPTSWLTFWFTNYLLLMSSITKGLSSSSLVKVQGNSAAAFKFGLIILLTRTYKEELVHHYYCYFQKAPIGAVSCDSGAAVAQGRAQRLIGRLLVLFFWSACQSVLGQDAEPQNCSWCAGRHLEWQPPPSVYECMYALL